MHASYYKRPLFWLLILYITLLACFYTPHPGANDIFHHISKQPVTVTGKVVGFPAIKKKSNNVIVKVYAIGGQPASGYVYARFKDYLPAWHETVEITGKLKRPYSVNLLGNFDWASYLASKNIFTEITVSDVKTAAPPSWPLRAIAAVRRDILHTFEQNFERNLAAIAGGVLLGERGEMEQDLYENFQNSGAIHLLVASGGNVGFVTLVVFAFCALFGLSRRKTVLLALVIAGIYTLIAGADAPLTRAYFMTVCAVVGYFLHRNSGVFQGLVLSCFIILISNPSALFETGFQMSFLATLAIVICLNVYELPYQWPRWVQFFVQIFLATLSTQLVLLPVFTNVFFKVSFVGLFSNMILVPLASFLMAVSFLFYVFSVLHLGFLLKAVAWGSLWSFKKLVELFAAQPFASIPAAAWRPGGIISYYAGLFLLFHLPLRDFVRRIWKGVLIVMIAAPLMQEIFFNSPTVWLLNEWNENVILLRTSQGKRFLFGAEIDGSKLARAVLRSGGRRVDGIFLNDAATKQTENIRVLQQQIHVGQVVTPFVDMWPGEEISLAGIKVRAEWGILLNRQKQLWTNTGYSGQEDQISYLVQGKNFEFTTAGNNRFILLHQQTQENVHNATRCVEL